MFWYLLIVFFIFFPLTIHATFIETSIGTAIVRDATATYYNPATLAALKKKHQFISLNAIGLDKSLFIGESARMITNFREFGSDIIHTNFLLPSLYYTMPLNTKWYLGTAVIYNNFEKEFENTLLRYAQPSFRLRSIDFIPALAYQITKKTSFGAALHYSLASFKFEPVFGFPNLSDIKALNESKGSGHSWDVGIYIKPSKKMILGLNHRSPITFNMHGTSNFSAVVSDTYRFNYWVPARTTLSISQSINSKLSLIGTVQYIQWSIFKEIAVFDLATPNGIFSEKIPYFYHNGWLFTAGTNYHRSEKWIFRIASSYTQARSDGQFQIDEGDAITIGASVAYKINKHLTLDWSYAYTVLTKQNIDIVNVLNTIRGNIGGEMNSFALKLTMSV